MGISNAVGLAAAEALYASLLWSSKDVGSTSDSTSPEPESEAFRSF